VFHPDELALIDAIHADPRDDTVRLVWADWLEEHDEPDCAEFIRLQCRESEMIVAPWGKPRLWAMTDPARYQTHPAGLRALELFDRLLGSSRYPDFNVTDWYIRGLPMYQANCRDHHLAERPPLHKLATPLLRLDVRLETARLGDWLEHPWMLWVDWLQITPVVNGGEAECERYWTEAISLLGESQLPDRLALLYLQGWMSDENREQVRLLLEPRVKVGNC
jgi:uncharacterized protein (TIGR02996 family)